MNKKGFGLFGVITFAAGSLVVVLFLAGMIYLVSQLTSTLLTAGTSLSTNAVNLTDAVQKTIVPVNAAMSQLHWIAFAILFSLAFIVILECYFVRSNPVFFFIHILVIILGIIGSIYISNYYETLMTTGILAPTIMGFKAASNLVLYLPLWVAVIGIVGLIVMAISANRDPEMRRTGF